MTEHDDDRGALEAFVGAYQDIVRRGDRDGFARVFHPSATVSFPDGGALVSTSAAAFAAEVADLVEAGVTVDERTRRFDVVVAGQVAVIRVDFALQIGDDHFEGTDFYTLARLDGGWQITQKLYDMAQVG